MCENWFELRNGVRVRCHRCWQCRADLVDDWVGRCTAELWGSKRTLCVDLTYGRDTRLGTLPHEHASALHYGDVQRYLKRLRKNVGPLRFFVAGEYGSTGSRRAHWHAILFFKKDYPEVNFRTRYVDEYWPHGFSWWKRANQENMRYAAKYILKRAGDGQHEAFYRFSSQPELGYGYFRDMARRYVEAQLPPRVEYRFAGAIEGGAPKEYRLSRTALFKFLDVYAGEWRSRFGDEDWPHSDLMADYEDWRARRARRRLGVADITIPDLDRRLELEKRQETGRWVTSDEDQSGMLWPPSWRSSDYLAQSKGE